MKQSRRRVQHQVPSREVLLSHNRSSWCSRAPPAEFHRFHRRNTRTARRRYRPSPCSGTPSRRRTDRRGRQQAQPSRAPAGAAQQPRGYGGGLPGSYLNLNNISRLLIPSRKTSATQTLKIWHFPTAPRHPEVHSSGSKMPPLPGSEWGNEPRAVGVPFLTLFESRLIHTISNLGANNV
jgi:hypothetical protein